VGAMCDFQRAIDAENMRICARANQSPAFSEIIDT